MKKYSKTIYVQEEKDGGSSYLLCWNNKDDVNNGPVAIYELKEMKNKKTKTILEQNFKN